MKKQTKLLSLIIFIIVLLFLAELFKDKPILNNWIYYSVIGVFTLVFLGFIVMKNNKNRIPICKECNEFPLKYKIKRPNEYYKIIEQVGEKINRGKFILIKGTCSLDEIKRDKPFPDDIIQHKFKCISCGSIFELFVDSYHGGGYWNKKNDALPGC